MNSAPDPLPSSSSSLRYVHRFAVATAVVTFGLIFLGGLVKSHEAGLSVPDWPNSYGWNMFTFPVKYWVGGILYEHTHRLLASLTGLMIFVEAVWLQRKDRRKWVRVLGWSAFAGVVVQGVFGGLTVHMLLETWVATVHSALAQTMFCLTIAMAAVTGKQWLDRSTDPELPSAIYRASFIAVIAIFIQLLLGAVMRHENAGLAISTFPLAENGSLIPDFNSFGVVIHFLHRSWAVVTSAAVLYAVWVSVRSQVAAVSRPAKLAALLLIIQVTLGAITILTHKAVTPTTFHVATGAALLGTMFLVTIRAKHLLGNAESVAAEAATASRPIYFQNA